MSEYKTDLEIAREANKKPIIELAKEKLSISDQDLIPYGHYKAKINSNFLDKVENEKDQSEKISINPYDQVPFHRKLIDKKNHKVGIFDLGNHILIIGLILIVIFVSLNVE